MRKKTTHSSSTILQLYHDFQIYRSLKSLQKTSNPYSVSRMSTTKKSRPSSSFSPPQIQSSLPKTGSPNKMKKRPMPKGISKFKEIQEMIEVQIRDDVKHYSEIGETALSGFKEKVSLITVSSLVTSLTTTRTFLVWIWWCSLSPFLQE